VLPPNGEVFHFSEDPTIREFVPHVAATAADDRPYVWAVDAARAPDYWFPRECPRAMAWVLPSTTAGDRDLVFGPGINQRVHTVEFGWLDAIIRCELFVYRLPADRFVPVEGDAPHAVVSVEQVRPAGPPEPVACWPFIKQLGSSCECSTTCGHGGIASSRRALGSAA
jgi:hypothetical protein